jgi:hypothetical protein
MPKRRRWIGRERRRENRLEALDKRKKRGRTRKGKKEEKSGIESELRGGGIAKEGKGIALRGGGIAQRGLGKAFKGGGIVEK